MQAWDTHNTRDTRPTPLQQSALDTVRKAEDAADDYILHGGAQRLHTALYWRKLANFTVRRACNEAPPLSVRAFAGNG